MATPAFNWRAWFDEARHMMASWMPHDEKADEGDLASSLSHEARGQVMRRIMMMYDVRVRAAEDRMQPAEAREVIGRLDGLLNLLLDGVKDTPDHLLEKMLDHSMLQDYERRFDEVMSLSGSGHH